MLATPKGISAGHTRHELDHHRSTLVKLETVFIRSKYEAGIALCVGPIGIETNFEAMLSIQRRNLQLYLGALFYLDGRRIKFVFFGTHFNDPHVLIRLRSVSWSGETSGNGKADSEKQRKELSRNSQLNFSFRIRI